MGMERQAPAVMGAQVPHGTITGFEWRKTQMRAVFKKMPLRLGTGVWDTRRPELSRAVRREMREPPGDRAQAVTILGASGLRGDGGPKKPGSRA